MASLGFHLLLLLLGASAALASKPPKSQVVKCAVCRSLINELHSSISQVDPRKKINVGSYRIDADGKQKLSSVKYAGSELHMMELLETVCESMKDYAQARHKETGRLEAIKLVVNGAMNPRFGEYEMVQDPDLNKGLEFHCNTLVEEFEDELVAHFRENAEGDIEDSQEALCYEVTNACTGVKDEL
ncbi:protein canopy homolog 2-like [Penaeus japonicus]|uniref:protein canopy homolog 2-like n=1 Tax=Penaeus japonicus TaxID=27405 RepID=UPI001C70FC2E|nr:protein canopy homolog 2-like [Penaeus japonicus]XP_042888604.1 protein canopy homolog 2-like [Penaeus japonicus]